MLTLGLITLPVPVRASAARQDSSSGNKDQEKQHGYSGYLIAGPGGVAHDFKMFLGDSGKCADEYNRKQAKK